MEAYQMDILLILFLLLTSFIALVYFRFYKKAMMDENRYFIFRLRDNLVYLVANGDLKESEFLYTDTIERLNSFVHNVQYFNLKSFVRVLTSYAQSAESEEYKKRLTEEILKHNPNVRKFFIDLFDTMITILLRNSVLLRIIYRSSYFIRITAKFIKKYANLTKKFLIFRTQVQAYECVQFCNSLKNM